MATSCARQLRWWKEQLKSAAKKMTSSFIAKPSPSPSLMHSLFSSSCQTILLLIPSYFIYCSDENAAMPLSALEHAPSATTMMLPLFPAVVNHPRPGHHAIVTTTAFSRRPPKIPKNHAPRPWAAYRYRRRSVISAGAGAITPVAAVVQSSPARARHQVSRFYCQRRNKNNTGTGLSQTFTSERRIPQGYRGNLIPVCKCSRGTRRWTSDQNQTSKQEPTR